MSPNPRLVSRKLLTRGEQMKEVPFLNLLAASWIQFQNHDWITHGENLTTEIIEIPLADDDPARRRYRQSNMFVGRTQPDPTRQAAGEETPVTFINEVTHWWDGSQLYGSDQETQDRLRSGVDGKLRLNPDGTLPVAGNGVEDTGMVRNWWVGLSMLHDLFAREHNAICDHLKVHHPDWEDARLFNVARLVNAAVMAKIHSIEWTPAILPNRSLELGLNSNWYGMLTYKFRKGTDRKTVADFNVSNPELGGLVGNHINKHGSPFGLTEEFVEVYRLHSLLPESLQLRSHSTGEDVEDMPFAATRQAGSHKVTAAHRDGQSLLLVWQPAPRSARPQQLPTVHAGAEHPRQPGVRHGRRRHPAGPGTWCPPLQRVQTPARPQPDPHLRRPDRRRRRRGEDQRGLRRGRRAARPARRHTGRRTPADRFRIRRDDVSDLHPQRKPPAASRPLLHR